MADVIAEDDCTLQLTSLSNTKYKKGQTVQQELKSLFLVNLCFVKTIEQKLLFMGTI